MKNQILIIAFAFIVSSIAAQQKGINQLPAAKRQLPTLTYAVVVGISDYQDPGIPDLRFADKDAEAFANYLRSNAGGKLDNDHIKVLINQQATMAQFANALDWLWESCKEGDQAIIYFSGHGDVEKKSLTQPGFLLCWDAPARVYMAGGAFALPMLQEVISTLSIQNKAKVIVITDACRSGTLAGSSVGGAQATASNLAKQFGNEIKIMSCQPNEYSIEGEQWGGGRGAFSYHLIDALYGLADNNNDQFVTLQEVGRYLEDHVTNEVAPVSQVPMTIGNRNERLSSVDAALLASIKSGKTSQMAMLTAIESKGMEEDVLSKVDTSIRKIYQLFKSSLKDKKLLEPKEACADFYYDKLIAEPKLERLHSTLKRNYAAALQDDAQQTMNIWIKADVKQLECIGRSIKLEPIPMLLDRAASLLGEHHYMHSSLIARKLLFQGVLLSEKYKNTNGIIGRQCLSLFKQANVLEPMSPLHWYRMAIVYLYNLQNPDSAIVCADNANRLAPQWVLPYTAIGGYFVNKYDIIHAKQALERADAIDSLHPYVLDLKGSWYYIHSDNESKKKALVLFEKYSNSDGPKYPCWYISYAYSLNALGKYKEALTEIQKAIALDSSETDIWRALGYTYKSLNRNNEAIQATEKAIKLDSTNKVAWVQLGSFYSSMRMDEKASIAFERAISLDSSNVKVWLDIGFAYLNNNQYPKAASAYTKSLILDSTNVTAWANLGLIYDNLNQYPESEKSYKKALAFDSTGAIVWSNLGSLYNDIRRFDEAEMAYKKALKFDSVYQIALCNLGLLYYTIKRYDESEKYLLRTIELDSTNSVAWSTIGLIYDDMGRFDQSERALKKAVVLDSINKVYWNNLGLFYNHTKRYAEAELVLQKAIALDSNFANPRKHLAYTQFKTGRFNDAKQGFFKAIELNPNYINAFLGMAYVFAKEGKIVEAIGFIEQAIKKQITYEQLQNDEDLVPLIKTTEWKELMKKYFPDK
jgi:tetratricopeptide (TPR) repeat protein